MLSIVLEYIINMGLFLKASLIRGLIWCIPIYLICNFILVDIFYPWKINLFQSIAIYVLVSILTKSDIKNVIKNNKTNV